MLFKIFNCDNKPRMIKHVFFLSIILTLFNVNDVNANNLDLLKAPHGFKVGLSSHDGNLRR